MNNRYARILLPVILLSMLASCNKAETNVEQNGSLELKKMKLTVNSVGLTTQDQAALVISAIDNNGYINLIVDGNLQQSNFALTANELMQTRSIETEGKARSLFVAFNGSSSATQYKIKLLIYREDTLSDSTTIDVDQSATVKNFEFKAN